MFDKKERLFWVAVVFAGIFSVWSIMNPAGLTNTLWAVVYKFHGSFGWFTVVMPFLALVICAYLAFSKYGSVKLGKEDDVPEFSTFSWIAMLFTAGIGVGLVNFGVAEPLIHYLLSPAGLAGGASEIDAAKNAMAITMYDWGLPAWSIYTLAGLVIGYFTYKKGAKFLPSTPIEHGFEDKSWAKPVGAMANVIAAGASALTMAASIGLGVAQVSNGVNAVTGLAVTGLTASIIILCVITLSYTLPAILPVKKGMKILGDVNVIIAIALLVFVFIFGPTRFFMENILLTFKETFTGIIPASFDTHIYQSKGYINDWQLTTMIWWVSWTPFMGIFVARISKGRTIKEIVLASISVPTLFLIAWFAVFGGYGLFDAIVGGGSIVDYVANNPNDVYLSFIQVLQALPLFQISGVIFVALIIIFLATGATSAAISLSMMTSDGAENPPAYKTLIWCLIMATIAFANVVTGTLDGIKAVAVCLGIPYLFFVVLQVAGLFRMMRRNENK